MNFPGAAWLIQTVRFANKLDIKRSPDLGLVPHQEAHLGIHARVAEEYAQGAGGNFLIKRARCSFRNLRSIVA